MDSKRRSEGRVILIISLSSIILWLIISSSSYHGDTLLDVLNHSKVINLNLFCEQIYDEGVRTIGGVVMPGPEECVIDFDMKTKTAIIFSFLFAVYGLLVFLGHAPGLTEVWSKLRERQNKS